MAVVVVTAMAWADAMRCEGERKRQDQPASASASSGVGGAPGGAPRLANSAARRLAGELGNSPGANCKSSVRLRHISEICSAAHRQPTRSPSKLARERLGAPCSPPEIGFLHYAPTPLASLASPPSPSYILLSHEGGRGSHINGCLFAVFVSGVSGWQRGR